MDPNLNSYIFLLYRDKEMKNKNLQKKQSKIKEYFKHKRRHSMLSSKCDFFLRYAS